MSKSATVDNETPLVSVGEKIKLTWTEEDGSSRTIHARVQNIEKSSKRKHGSLWKYELCLYKENDAIVSTRLAHLPWERKKKEKRTNETTSEMNKSNKKSKPSEEKSNHNSNANTIVSIPSCLPTLKNEKRTVALESLKYVVAPMVGGSELAFRLLCRRYGATIAYTPMMNSEKFAVDAEYRNAEFQTTPEDRPVVAHFSANDPNTFLQAALHVQDQCDAIDLNLGCPQRIAHSGHFGSYLLDPVDRPLVLSMVRTLSTNIRIPIFVKIRLLNTIEESIELCQQLVEAGAALIAIHGRYRVNLVGRSGPGARDGAAHLDQIAQIRQAITPSVPILSNGNVTTWDDVQQNLITTGTEGIMSAEGLLDNPALFNNGVQVDKIKLALEYLELVQQYPVKIKSVVFHVRRICRDILTKYQLLEECVVATTPEQIHKLILQAKEYEEKGNFQEDALKAKLAKEAYERRKYEEGKRKAYEDRMIRKAKREGKALDYYLTQGSEAPSEENIQELLKLSTENRFLLWKEKYAQQCYAFHLSPEGCKRDRTCSFLHSDSKIAEAIAYG